MTIRNIYWIIRIAPHMDMYNIYAIVMCVVWCGVVSCVCVCIREGEKESLYVCICNGCALVCTEIIRVANAIYVIKHLRILRELKMKQFLYRMN